MAAYAHLASAGEAQPLQRVYLHARELAAPAHWTVRPSDLGPPVRAGVLWRGPGQVALTKTYRQHWAYFQVQAQRLYRLTTFLVNSPEAPEMDTPTYRGLALFSFGLFFACHEHFEELWRQASPQDRNFYQGMVQLAAAFYHHEKGNRHGAVVLLRRAAGRLAGYRPQHRGLHVEPLLQELASWEARFAQGLQAPYAVLVPARTQGTG
ncbi:MAG: hypothetical protein C4303_02580 [candidate division GAL15 bacterium]